MKYVQQFVLLDGERIRMEISPSDILTFDPISFAVPFILAFIAWDYHSENILVSLAILAAGILYFIYDYLVFRNTKYIITDRRIVAYNGVRRKMRGMPVSAVENVGFKQSFIQGKSRSVVINDRKGNSIELKGIKEWKEVSEFLLKGKYGENVIINF